MRHGVKAKHFNRDSKHRKALLTNLIRFLIENGEIVTTLEKAKEVKRLADKVIAKAQTDSLTTRRQLHTIFGKRDVVNTLVDKVAKAFSDRKSGFTTISVVGQRRGDNSAMAKLSLVSLSAQVGKIEKNGLKKASKAVKAKTKDVAKKVETKKVVKPKAEKAKKVEVKKIDKIDNKIEAQSKIVNPHLNKQAKGLARTVKKVGAKV